MSAEPVWLTAKVDQRLALMEGTLGIATAGLAEYRVVMTPLTEPGEGCTDAEIERWDRTCDRCGRYCPPEEDFYSGETYRERHGTTVLFTFAICAACVGQR